MGLSVSPSPIAKNKVELILFLSYLGLVIYHDYQISANWFTLNKVVGVGGKSEENDFQGPPCLSLTHSHGVISQWTFP